MFLKGVFLNIETKFVLKLFFSYIHGVTYLQGYKYDKIPLEYTFETLIGPKNQ